MEPIDGVPLLGPGYRANIETWYCVSCPELDHENCENLDVGDTTFFNDRRALRESLRERGWKKTRRYGWLCPPCQRAAQRTKGESSDDD